MRTEDICHIVEGDSAVIATAIHAGHAMRASLKEYTKLTDPQRLREEDPFTDMFASAARTRIIATHSRFQVDLNRPRDRAVYQRPEDAWGLDIWKELLPQEEISRSQQEYDGFYATLKEMLDKKLKDHSQLVVFDIHSYNHRRMGERAPFDDPIQNPEIIIGTGTMPDRERWQDVITLVTEKLENAVVMGHYLDVRENVKFQGGHMAQWIHTHYPDRVCCISLEFKKFFMNEWSGEPQMAVIHEIEELMEAIVNFLETIT